MYVCVSVRTCVCMCHCAGVCVCVCCVHACARARARVCGRECVYVYECAVILTGGTRPSLKFTRRFAMTLERVLSPVPGLCRPVLTRYHVYNNKKCIKKYKLLIS